MAFERIVCPLNPRGVLPCGLLLREADDPVAFDRREFGNRPGHATIADLQPMTAFEEMFSNAPGSKSFSVEEAFRLAKEALERGDRHAYESYANMALTFTPLPADGKKAA